MELTGCCFVLDVPPTWGMETDGGVVTVTSDESFAGFIPNAVLRGSRLMHLAPTPLAVTPQVNLAVLSTRIPGFSFFHVETIPNANVTSGPAECRRPWTFSMLRVPEMHGNVLCLLMIQDLLVVDGMITEVTATVPPMAWHHGNMYKPILDGLRPLPSNVRQIPHMGSDVLGVDLDD